MSRCFSNTLVYIEVQYFKSDTIFFIITILKGSSSKSGLCESWPFGVIILFSGVNYHSKLFHFNTLFDRVLELNRLNPNLKNDVNLNLMFCVRDKILYGSSKQPL